MLHSKNPIGKSSDQKISTKLGLLRYGSDLNKSIVGYKQGQSTGHVRKSSMAELNIRPDILENTNFFNKRPRICDPTYARGTQYRNTSNNSRAQVLSPPPNLTPPTYYPSSDQNYRSEPRGNDIWGLAARLPYAQNPRHKPSKTPKKNPSSYRQIHNNSIDFHNNSIMSNHNNSTSLYPQDPPTPNPIPAPTPQYYSKISNRHNKNWQGMIIGNNP